MNNKVDPGKQTVDKFKRSVVMVKAQIVENIKREQKYLKEIKHAKSDNDKNALMANIRQTRNVIEAYRTALNDLTYAFMQYNRIAGLKLAKRFGYQTVEGYLADKKDSDVMPNLGQMIELIANHYPAIPRFYKFDYSGPTKRIIRNFSTLDRKDDYLIHSRTSGVRKIPDIPNYVSQDPRKIERAVQSGSRHR